MVTVAFDALASTGEMCSPEMATFVLRHIGNRAFAPALYELTEVGEDMSMLGPPTGNFLTPIAYNLLPKNLSGFYFLRIF